jgi:hypothetical protein
MKHYEDVWAVYIPEQVWMARIGCTLQTTTSRICRKLEKEPLKFHTMMVEDFHELLG